MLPGAKPHDQHLARAFAGFQKVAAVWMRNFKVTKPSVAFTSYLKHPKNRPPNKSKKNKNKRILSSLSLLLCLHGQEKELQLKRERDEAALRAEKQMTDLERH